MYRATPAKSEELDILMALQRKNLSKEDITAREILEYRHNSFGKWLRVCREDDRFYGFISARPVDIPAEKGMTDEMFSDSDMPEGDTMVILSIVSDKVLEECSCSRYMENYYENLREEIYIFLLRVLIIESRMTGEYERVLITVPESRAAYFKDLGFHELRPSEVTVIKRDEPLVDMEYFLNNCQGNCSFCRAC